MLHFPAGPYRFNLFHGGERILEGGLGTTSEFGVEMKPDPEAPEISLLVEHLGGSGSGNRQVEDVGLFGPIESIVRLDGVRFQIDRNQPPFDNQSMRGYIPESGSGEESSSIALSWTFNHLRRKSLRVLLGMPISGCWLINDQPFIRSERSTCPGFKLVPGSTPGMKRGKNVLTFRPDVACEDRTNELVECLTINEITEEIGIESGSISFARNRIPDGMTDRYEPWDQASDGPTGIPTWYRTEIASCSGPVALELGSMSRGIVFVNEEPAGMFDSSISSQVSIPREASSGPMRIDLLDVMGCPPGSINLLIANH